ncbi:MAG: hypothetical protein R3E57_10020 [Porticoccaceae bacterium]
MRYYHFMLFGLTLVLVSMENAYAYLDPGSGSIILQAIIAAFAMGLFVIKTWWYRIMGFFKGEKSRQEDGADKGDKEQG